MKKILNIARNATQAAGEISLPGNTNANISTIAEQLLIRREAIVQMTQTLYSCLLY
jgi:hypothetical protein